MRTFLLSGFEAFGGERTNPSWEVARRLDGRTVGGLQIRAIRLPVDCARTARLIAAAIGRTGPAAVLALGQAGGRPALSLERVAINLIATAAREAGGGDRSRPVIRGGPDAYFSRLPLERIARALRRRGVPAAYSLTAGAFACNAAMYAALHALRRRRAVPCGLIHLPYEPRQAARHRGASSMSLETMSAAVEAAIAAVARA